MNNNNCKNSSSFLHCLEPLLQALYWPGNRLHLMESLPCSEDTMHVDWFLETMQTLRYDIKQFSIQLNLLDSNLLPCLFVTGDKKTYVIFEKTQDMLSVFDGESATHKKIRASNTEGTAYLFTPLDPIQIERDRAKNNWFQKTLFQFRHAFYSAFFASFFINLLSLSVPLFVMVVYNQVINSGSFSAVYGFAIGVFFALGANFILQILQSRLLNKASAQLHHFVGSKVFERLLYLAPSYTESANISAQVMRLKDFDNVREFLNGPQITLLFDMPFVCLVLIVMAIWNIKIALIPVILFLVFGIFYFITRAFIRRQVEMTAAAANQRQAFLLDALNTMPVLKSLSVESIWFQRYRDLSAQTAMCNYRFSLLNTWINSVADALMILSGLGILGVGCLTVMNGEMSVGALIATMMIAWRILNPIKTFFTQQQRFDQMRASILQINALMKINPEREPGLLANPIKDLSGDIRFNHITVRYQPDKEPALANINFSVKSGEIIAIVGRNASGKSTLLKLLLGLYKQQAGNITIGGRDIRQWDPIELRRAIGYVPQSPHLFRGTIADNLRLAKPTAHFDELILAAKNADVLDEIQSLPDGFNTDITVFNKTALSASFMQRLALARAYLKNPDILLFDEPHTSLDVVGERTWIKALKTFQGRATQFFISHKPAHLMLADRIVLLNDGQLLLAGPAADVLQRLPKEFL